jgi:hypothetical protein
MFSSFSLLAQEKESAGSSVDDKSQDDIKFMVNSLQTMLNILGDSTESQQDKDQIISQSYLKYFDSDKVQIEDDLEPNRPLPFNKNVQAYLQDVVFFYKSIVFTFDIKEITKGLNDKNKIYYKVSMEEHLQGINLYGEPIKEINPRYIEFNHDEKSQEYKIVSIYTTKLSEKEDLSTWWNEMDIHWRKYFAPSLFYQDSTSIESILVSNPKISINDTLLSGQGDTIFFNTPSLFNSIKSILNWTKIHVVASDSIHNLKPLNKMVLLESVNFSNCLVDDISPLRSTLSITEINADNTLLSNMDELQYLSSLQKISIGNTAISDLSVTSAWTSLEDLSMANSQITDFSFLSNIAGLKNLNITGNKTEDFTFLKELNGLLKLNLSSTSFTDFSTINSLTGLHSLYLDDTNIDDLNGLSDSLQLNIISIENTKIADLLPLIGITTLKMIYCDNSMVKKENVEQFIVKNPNIIIIYETKSLQNWWANLDENLKTFIRSKLDTMSDPPNTETLHQIIFTETADLSGQKSINSIEGFQQLINLRKLNISGTSVIDLSPISAVSLLEDLNISYTDIVDVSPLAKNTNLSNLDIEHTDVHDISSLTGLSSLKLIKADSSGITQSSALDFNKINRALLLYQSSFLIKWWNDLPKDWEQFFRTKIKLDKNPTEIELQTLVDMDSLEISNFKNDSLHYLSELKLLVYLKLDHNNTSNLSPLLELEELSSLSINNGSVNDIISIGKMTQLTALDVSTTSLTNIDFIATLVNLKSLNISGTAIQSIKVVSNLSKLEYIDISNTRVKKLNDLNNLPNLKEVKLTNAATNQKKVDSFKKSNPNVKVVVY